MTMESKNCPQCGAPLPVNAPAGLCPRCVIAMNMAVQTEFTEEAGPHDTRVAKQQPPSPAELAGKFPNLEILELLGQGGMGAVYKARQKELDRIVALKILPPAVSEDPAFAERFSREARALARLNHPNIVTLYEFGRADGLYFFLMEFVDGVSLRQLLDTSRVSSREALAIVPQICDALQYAHDQGIVHRDIKPENILMDRRGRVKVADFGLAKLVSVAHGGDGDTGMESPVNGQAGKPALQGEALTDAGKIMGTPQYMAPEQKERPLEVDHRADIYALGVVFYQMLTGELPSQRIEPPSKKVLIDVRLDEIVLRALEKDPERRYGQASVLKTQVESVASSMEETRASEQTGEASVPPAKGSANRFEDNSPKPKLLWITLVTLGLGALSNLVLGSWVLAYKLGFLESLVLCLPINAFMVWKIWRSLHPVAASDRTSTPISRRFGWLPIASVLTIVALIFAGVFLAGRAKDTEQIRVNLEKELREQISELLAEKRMTFSRMQFEYSTVLPRAFVTFTGLEEHRNKTNAMPMTGALHLAFDTRGTCVVSGRGDLQEVQRTWPIRELNLISWPRRVGPTEDEQFHTDDSFAAVVVALDSLNRPSKNRFLDLDSGKVVAPPKDYFEWSRMRREQWLRENGIDLMVLGNNLQPWWLLTPVDNPIQLAGISIETWRRGIEPEPTATTPVKGEELQFPDLNLGLISFHLKHHRPTHPEHTFLFQTANGRRGMLRISGTIVEGIETLAGVKIEFKALANDKPILFEPVQIESARIEPSESAPRTDWFTVLLGSVLIVAIGLYWLLIRSKKTKADAQGARTPSPRLIHALRSVAIAVAIVLVLRTFVVAPFYALSDAASPEVPKGSWVLVYKLGRSFKPGDVVVFKSGGRDKLGRVLDQYYRAGSNEGIVIIERDHTEVLHRDVVGKVVFNTRASRASAQEPLNVWSDLPGNTMASGLDSGSDHGASPRTDFSAELPDGSFVELVAIQHTGGPAPRQPTGSTNRIDFWNPDGTKHINNLGWSFSPSAVSPQRIPGWGYRGFVVHWNGPAANNTRLMAWEVDGNPEASGIYNVNSPRYESAEKWLGILQGFPSDQNTAKLRFALASGPYLEGPPEKKNLIWSRSDKTPWGSYSIGEIFDHNGNAAITLTHNLKGCDYRLYTEFSKLPDIPKSVVGGLIWEMQEESRRDQRYKRTYGRLVKSGAGSSQSMEVWEFPGIPAREAMAKRPSIYFEVRPVQWVEFDNVALHPEKFVPVNIRVGNEQEARATKANPIISEPVR